MKGTEHFFLAAEFYGHSSQIILKRVCNTNRRAKNAGKFSYRPVLKGQQTDALIFAWVSTLL
jgi:hypothetical protein